MDINKLPENNKLVRSLDIDFNILLVVEVVDGHEPIKLETLIN